MDGDVAPMRDIIRLAALYDAQVLIITGRLLRCYILYNIYTNICYILHIHIYTFDVERNSSGTLYAVFIVHIYTVGTDRRLPRYRRIRAYRTGYAGVLWG